jgi:hypothetical protein
MRDERESAADTNTDDWTEDELVEAAQDGDAHAAAALYRLVTDLARAAENRKAREAREREAVALLTEFEWYPNADDDHDFDMCNYCGGFRHEGHAEGCRLAAFLAASRSAPLPPQQAPCGTARTRECATCGAPLVPYRTCINPDCAPEPIPGTQLETKGES